MRPTRWILIGLSAAMLAGCARYTEKTSPCVCDWVPVSAAELVAV